jgi:deoxyribodipyrimidine photo-lyase
LCSWKWGEKYFADHLLDFDLASNNGGWQWAASVGCDAQPYFRIFNPVLQSERFDPEGVFLKAELPELKKLPLKYLHAPWTATPMELLSAGVKLGDDYPHPIVNHAEQKDKAIKLFKN